MRAIDVRRGYDLWAPTYDQLDNPLVAMTELAMGGWRPEGDRVLEIGCGTARHAPFFLERGFASYVGVDVSEGMLAAAAARARDPRVRLVHGDAAEVVEPGGFDGVLISLVLEHVADVRPLLSAAGRAARAGGWLRIHELHPRLRERGTRAHFHHEGEELLLPSHAHDVAELEAALSPSWSVVTVTDWYADPAASPKLARHAGRPVLLDLLARRG